MIKFSYPWVWIFIFLPILAYFLLPASKRVESSYLNVPFFTVFEQLNMSQTLWSKKHSWRQWILPFLIWILLLCAASEPIWLGHPIYNAAAGRNILMAVDISGSMEMPDMSLEGRQVNRLDLVKVQARRFVESRQGDRLGLILFGSKAYLQTPLTFDRKTVIHMLNDATIGLAGSQTAIGDAIGLAIKQFINMPLQGRVLILLTDGGNNAGNVFPLEAAEVAKAQHIRIYTIGLGASQIIVPGLFGPEVIKPNNDLDEQTLKQIAQMTGGVFFKAQNASDLKSVYHSINQLEPVQGSKTYYQSRQELYPWPLLIAFLLILYLRLYQLRHHHVV